MNEIIYQIFNYMNIFWSYFGRSEQKPYFQRLKLPVVTIAVNDFDARISAW